MEKIKKEKTLDDDIQDLLQDDVEIKLKELSQKKANRKKQSRKIRRMILLVLLGILMIYLLSDASKVKSLNSTGNVFYKNEEIYKKANLSYETRYLFYPSFLMKWKLESDPFIDMVEVDKKLDGVITIEVSEEPIFGYRITEEKTMAIFADGKQQEIPSEDLMSIANYMFVGNFSEEQLEKLLTIFYKENDPIKTDILSMISEIQPYEASYDENMVRIIMRDGNMVYGSYNSIRLLNYYKQTLASLNTHPACLSMDEATSSIVSLTECP